MYRSVGDDSGVLFTQPLYSNTGVPFNPGAELTPDQLIQAAQAPVPAASVTSANPAIRTAKPRYACPAGQDWQQVLDKMSGAVVWKCMRATAALLETTPVSVSTDFVAPAIPPPDEGMSTTEMVMIGVGGVAVLGLGYVLLKKKR